MSQSAQTQNEEAAEGVIRQRVENLVQALRAKDIDRAMSFYAPNLVSFDITPPLRYFGADGKRRAWQEAFGLLATIDYEIRDLHVTTHGDLAFAHSVNRMKGTLASGHVMGTWLRWTACLRRVDGAWLIVHDHVSVPADFEHGKAVLDLTP